MTASRDPYALAERLENSGQAAATASDLLTAEAEWVRALAIWRRLQDRSACVRVLRSLIAMYGAWGRWHHALDAVFEIEMTIRRPPCDPTALAGALADIGITMLHANRPDSAAHYLKHAVTAYGQLATPAPIGQAAALLWWGRALWTQGAWIAGRRRFQTALALLVDVDDTLADQAQQLVNHPKGQPLPELGGISTPTVWAWIPLISVHDHVVGGGK